MKYLSLFSGVGGFELGIQKAVPDSECVGNSEIDPYADAIYKYNFGGTNLGDCTKIDPTTIPDFDLLVGGFPCQAFSIAGKRRGFEDTRGTLIFDVLRILKEKQPRHFILENVKGLLSHDSGNTFKTIITSLAELGYAVEWQVLNAKNFGVPQNRERVFIVGHLGGFGGRQIFPIREDERVSDETDTADESRTQAEYSSSLRSSPAMKADQTFIKVAGTLETGGWEKRHEQIRRVHDVTGLSPTIPTGTGGGVMNKIFKDAKIRRLTPTECERLMGYPDDWTKWGMYDNQWGGQPGRKEMSDTRRYKACGNGVVSNVVEEVVRRLYADSPELSDATGK